jgi:hypothetical protein
MYTISTPQLYVLCKFYEEDSAGYLLRTLVHSNIRAPVTVSCCQAQPEWAPASGRLLACSTTLFAALAASSPALLLRT